MTKSVKQMLAGTMTGVLMLGLVAAAVPAPNASAAKKKPKLSTKKVTVKVKKTKKVKIKKTIGIKKTTWTVKSKKIAKLSKKKKTSVTIKGVKKGKTTVTAKVKVKKKTYKLKLKVTVKSTNVTPKPSVKPTINPTARPSTKPTDKTPSTDKPVNGTITLDRTTLTVPYNASIQLNATVTPESLASKVVWTSSNEAVATVKNGMVSGIEKGTATITATLGTNKVTCAVTVTKEDFGTVVMNCDFNDGKIEPWGPRAASTAPTATIDDNGYDGKCPKITDRNSNAQGALLDLSEMVEPSATYEFSTYVRLADDAQDNAAIILSSETKAVANGDEKYANIKCITTKKSNWGCAADYILKDPRQWQQVTYQVTTPDDVSHFGLYFEAGNCVNSDLFVDSTQLKLISRNVPDYTIPSLYENYKNIFPNMGVAVDYNQLMGANTMKFVKAQYNSVTMGNSMKPDAILPSSNDDSDMVTEEEAKALGYYVSEDYVNQAYNKKNGKIVYPKLRFNTVDALLKRAHDNGLKMRFHVLVWHQQTPVYFFKAGYLSATTGRNVSPETMDTRVEWYVKTVFDHVMKSPYADVIYATDVVNEYFHSHKSDDSTVNTNGVTYWEAIYNTEDPDASGKMITTPSYVKLAFKCAYDVLVANKRTDVALIYNDYNTYGEDTADRMVSMYKWLNTKDDINTNGDKICAGVGMQTHLDAGNSYHSVEKFKAALDKFRTAGMEIQITEWDATNQRGMTEEEMAQYWRDIMKALIDTKKAGGNITGVTIWGLYDATSWRANYNPLPFTGLFNVKDSFTALIDLAKAQN